MRMHGRWVETGRAAPRRRRRRRWRRRGVTLRYLGSDGAAIHWDLIRLALGSVAALAIFPLQDVLGLGSEARVNRPGTLQGNWEWRVRPGALDAALAARLRAETELFDRLPR